MADDASYKIFETLRAIDGQSNATISFERGEYNFYPDKADERFCFISNHNDVLSRVAFNIDGVDGLTIDGNGSTFIFHGLIIPFWIANSSDITVKNLTVDWDDTFHSEAMVVANSVRNNSFDIEIGDEYPYEIRNGELVFLKPYYEHTIGQSILYDPALEATAFNTERSTPITTKRRLKSNGVEANFSYPYKVDSNEPYIRERGIENSVIAVQLKPGLVRITGHKKELPAVGMVLAMKGDHGNNRFAPAFKADLVKGFTAKSVTVNHACGMGFLFEHSENIELNDCKVVPSRGRMVSTTADATHFVGCRGQVKLIDCVFNNQLDDAMNVHGAYQEVVDIIDNHTVGIRVGHFQQQGFVLGFAGDKVGVVRLSDSFFPYNEMSIKHIERVNGRYHVITFNEALPSAIEVGDLLENLSAYPEVLVEGCDISRNRARGLLISTPRKTIVRDNHFATEMEAILIPVESGSWFESGSVADLLITGNIFENSMTAGFNRGVIRFVTDDDNANVAFTNVEISDNEFNHYDNLIIEASNVDSLRVLRNEFTASKAFEQQFPNNPAFIVKHSSNVLFEGNDYKGTAHKMIEVSDDMSKINFK